MHVPRLLDGVRGSRNGASHPTSARCKDAGEGRSHVQSLFWSEAKHGCSVLKRTKAWTSLGFGHGRPLLKRTTPWTSVRFGHGCAVLERTRPWTPFFSGMESLFSIAPDHVRHQVLGMDALVSIALDHDVIRFWAWMFCFQTH